MEYTELALQTFIGVVAVLSIYVVYRCWLYRAENDCLKNK